MFRIIKAFLVINFGFSSGYAFAHGGGLNAEGCHNNRKTGGYHCHRSSSKPITHYRSAPMASSLSRQDSASSIRMSKLDIQTAQYLLSGLGYYSFSIDGQYGENTQRAIMAFQRDNALIISGLIDPELLLKLARETEMRLKKVG